MVITITKPIEVGQQSSSLSYREGANHSTILAPRRTFHPNCEMPSLMSRGGAPVYQ